MIMEVEREEGLSEPVSPTGQYMRSSALSLSIISVTELEIPMAESIAIQLVKELFLPINPRFSSIMIAGEDGQKKWKRVEVNVNEHVNFPKFPQGMSPDYYDDCLSNYLSKLGMEDFPPERPLWEIHVINYPTTNAASNIVFKLHHALGDGYSLVGALLSCLKRSDNPSLPLTFPSRQSKTKFNNASTTFLPDVFSRAFNTIYYFGYGVLKGFLLRDDHSPIRSDDEGVLFRPLTMTTMEFSLDQFKQIKAKLQVTINDVIMGTIMFGTRIYMREMNHESSEANCTAVVLLNTRYAAGYKSVSEMIKPNAEMPWGNRFAILPLPIPKLTATESSDPLSFVLEAHQIIQRQRNSASVLLTSYVMETMRRVKGPEAVARYMRGILKNSSMAITNVIEPVEQMSLADHPVKGIYFAVPGDPQSLHITVISYAGKLRICLVTEKDFIDPCKLKSCINNAFEAILEAAVQTSPQNDKLISSLLI